MAALFVHAPETIHFQAFLVMRSSSPLSSHGTPKKKHRLKGPAGWNWTVYNCGAGVPFQGWKTRLTGFQQFLATLNDTQIVVLLDGGDVMYAGCDMGFFRRRYEELCALLNTKIIFSAEANCWPDEAFPFCRLPRIHDERALVLPQLSNIKPEMLDSMTRGGRRYQHLNFGFQMGRAKDLRVLYQRMNEVSVSVPNDDQYWAWHVWREHPWLVGLDYTSALATSLAFVELSTFTFKGGQWQNYLTKEPVCFFHGNGPAKTLLQSAIDSMAK
eukprot:CAMPEP_0117491660 /NCGR_PEP_ID=MMETSP0784-20121206/18182_1 /TAXON_ID=39447 /ORGANISM="" /LENGTH=270 /DNA_ID=CAMNT_0005286459 /DNA_START=328 /DNA_END=1139 /DNA_ORIENTATION=-